MSDPSLADRLAELRKASWHPARTFLPAEWDDVVNKAVEALRLLERYKAQWPDPDEFHAALMRELGGTDAD